MSSIVKEIDGLEVPEPEITLWMAQKIHSKKFFDNEEDFITYIINEQNDRMELENNLPQMITDVNHPFYTRLIGNMNIITSELIRLDYLEELAGHKNVIMASKLYFHDNKLLIRKRVFKTLSAIDGYILISHGGNLWQCTVGDLDDEYKAFEKYMSKDKGNFQLIKKL